MDTENVVVTKQDRKYKTLVTDIGKEKMTNAILNGKKVNVVMAAVGDGGGSYYLPTADMTALVHEVWRGAIASKEINSKSSNMVDVKFVLPGTVGGFTAREAALIDDEGDMIAVCNLPDTGEGSHRGTGIAAALHHSHAHRYDQQRRTDLHTGPDHRHGERRVRGLYNPHEAWQSAGGAEDDEGGGTYPCRADVACDEATAMPHAHRNAGQGVPGGGQGVRAVPHGGDRERRAALLGDEGAGRRADRKRAAGRPGRRRQERRRELHPADGNPLPPGRREGGDGLTVDNEGKLSVDAANTEETTGALNEVFGAEDGQISRPTIP